jgi:hypothetical protein
MKRQFDDVSCRYGAPMGRQSYGSPIDCEVKTIRLFKVSLDCQGYDDGGAYWGINSNGKFLYCATDNANYRGFTRADSRYKAMVQLSIPDNRLKIWTV